MAKNERRWPDPVPPDVQPDPHGRGSLETHPAYAVVRASRVSCSPGVVLFGSDFRHRQVIHLAVARADRRRDLSTDWVHHNLGQDLIQVALTEAQWATFVSSLNIGEGVPCTVEQVAGEPVPGIAQVTDRRQQFRDELLDRLDVVKQALVDLGKQIEASPLSGKKKADMASLLHTATMNLAGNLDFVAEQFDEHVEATVERAKAEIHGHIGSVLAKAGLKQLAADMPTMALPMLTDGQAEGPQPWECGCGTMNPPDQATCALCGRYPGERP